MKKNLMPLLMALSIGLLYIIKNIYFFIMLFTGVSVYMVYNIIKSIINIKNYKVNTFSKIDLYCREPGVVIIFLIILMFTIIISSWDIDFIYILKNFSKISFKEQHNFIYTISCSIWVICPLIMYICDKIKSNNWILYKEGFLLGDGKLYSFDSVKSYEFKTSWKGIKYNNLVLTFDNKVIKILYIYNEDIDKFKDLLERL